MRINFGRSIKSEILHINYRPLRGRTQRSSFVPAERKGFFFTDVAAAGGPGAPHASPRAGCSAQPREGPRSPRRGRGRGRGPRAGLSQGAGSRQRVCGGPGTGRTGNHARPLHQTCSHPQASPAGPEAPGAGFPRPAAAPGARAGPGGEATSGPGASGTGLGSAPGFKGVACARLRIPASPRGSAPCPPTPLRGGPRAAAGAWSRWAGHRSWLRSPAAGGGCTGRARLGAPTGGAQRTSAAHTVQEAARPV